MTMATWWLYYKQLTDDWLDEWDQVSRGDNFENIPVCEKVKNKGQDLVSKKMNLPTRIKLVFL